MLLFIPPFSCRSFRTSLRVWFYLDSRQHDGDQVVVWEQEGADDAAVTDVLDDGWEGSGRMSARTGGDRNAGASQRLPTQPPTTGAVCNNSQLRNFNGTKQRF